MGAHHPHKDNAAGAGAGAGAGADGEPGRMVELGFTSETTITFQGLGSFQLVLLPK